MAIAIALLGFNNLGRSVTPTFLSETDFIYNYLHILQKWTKHKCGKVIKFHDFCPRDIECFHHAAARRVKLWSLNANLFFEEPHQLTKFASYVHLHYIWQRTFSFKALIGHVRYINIRVWLRGFQVKIANFSSFLCPSIPKSDLDTKKTTPNIEVWPESLGAMLEYWYIERGLLQYFGTCSHCGLLR